MNCQTEHPHILLVEDSEDDAFFFRFALEATRLPCTVAHVADGAAAMDYLSSMGEGRAHPVPHLVFLDLKLPGYSGFDVLRWIRERTFNPELKIAILSGSDHEADINLARELGVTDYLVKPISGEELRKRILALRNAGSEADEPHAIKQSSAA